MLQIERRPVSSNLQNWLIVLAEGARYVQSSCTRTAEATMTSLPRRRFEAGADEEMISMVLTDLGARVALGIAQPSVCSQDLPPYLAVRVRSSCVTDDYQ